MTWPREISYLTICFCKSCPSSEFAQDSAGIRRLWVPACALVAGVFPSGMVLRTLPEEVASHRPLQPKPVFFFTEAAGDLTSNKCPLHTPRGSSSCWGLLRRDGLDAAGESVSRGAQRCLLRTQMSPQEQQPLTQGCSAERKSSSLDVFHYKCPGITL